MLCTHSFGLRQLLLLVLCRSRQGGSRDYCGLLSTVVWKCKIIACSASLVGMTLLQEIKFNFPTVTTTMMMVMMMTRNRESAEEEEDYYGNELCHTRSCRRRDSKFILRWKVFYLFPDQHYKSVDFELVTARWLALTLILIAGRVSLVIIEVENETLCKYIRMQ